MLGYLNNEEETKKVLINGWLHTGDIGIIENSYLKITDRKKDILITPGGDNISPIKIENELVNLEFIEQAVIVGEYELDHMPSEYMENLLRTLAKYPEHSVLLMDLISILRKNEIIDY